MKTKYKVKLTSSDKRYIRKLIKVFIDDYSDICIFCSSRFTPHIQECDALSNTNYDEACIYHGLITDEYKQFLLECAKAGFTAKILEELEESIMNYADAWYGCGSNKSEIVAQAEEEKAQKQAQKLKRMANNSREAGRVML